ncbi:hypothetical protein F5I97DRAFT_1874187 [Phlebopus sp. FC_14]|nr:hypothetical protein F5I97DRAFT_1874187 [Phlebopus sp. FC_14]
MHYRTDSPSTSRKDFAPPHHKSWTPTSHSGSSSYGHQADRWSASTVPPASTPGAPHLHTVSLPHPNSAPRYSSSSYPSPPGPGTSAIMSLNPLLSHDAVAPILFDVRKDVQCIQLRPGCPSNLLQAPAVNPSSTRLSVSIRGFPSWPIEITNARGVTVYDVLVKIREVLNWSLSPQEAAGVKRVDFLGPNVFFAGLSRASDGRDRWEAHFSQSA